MMQWMDRGWWQRNRNMVRNVRHASIMWPWKLRTGVCVMTVCLTRFSIRNNKIGKQKTNQPEQSVLHEMAVLVQCTVTIVFY
jgi:hypothetical protein